MSEEDLLNQDWDGRNGARMTPSQNGYELAQVISGYDVCLQCLFRTVICNC